MSGEAQVRIPGDLVKGWHDDPHKLAARSYLRGHRAGWEAAEVDYLAEFAPSPEAVRELGEWLRAPFNPRAALRARADEGPRVRAK